MRNFDFKRVMVGIAVLGYSAVHTVAGNLSNQPAWWVNAWNVVQQQSDFMSRSVIASGKLPRSLQYGLVSSRDWTSGFFPGTLWYIYAHTGDKKWCEKAKKVSMLLKDEQYNATDHDTGFRMYCSFGNGWLFTGNKDYKEVVIRSARTLASRYSYKTGLIMSWEPNSDRDWQYPVIIDNMMNLELIMEASKLAGDTLLRCIALNHADKTMKYQYRADYSCPHVVDYDADTGKMRKHDWNNGSKDPNTSVWSRGQSWGLYGFTMMYRETGDKRYLTHAGQIADFLLAHPNLPADMIPYWDYSDPGISKVRDSSAAAIMASGLLELSCYVEKGECYFKAAEKILQSLASPEYLAKPGTHGDFILKHATGNYMYKSELDGALVYGDYYFVEGLLRYLNLLNNKKCLDYVDR